MHDSDMVLLRNVRYGGCYDGRTECTCAFKLQARCWFLAGASPSACGQAATMRTRAESLRLTTVRATARHPIILMRNVSIVQPQTRPLVSGRVESRHFYAGRIYRDIPTSHR